MREEDVDFLARLIPDALIVLTTEAGAEYAGAAFTQYTGVIQQQAGQAGWIEAVHPDDRTHCAAPPPWSSQIRLLRSDGAYRRFEARAVPDQRTGSRFVVCVDVEDRQLLREELNQCHEEFQRFAFVTSHDLQEPLRTISSLTALLGSRYKEKLDAEADRLIDWIDGAVGRARSLITALLEFARVAENAGEKRPVDCELLLEEALLNLDRKIRDTGATVDHDPLPVVEADEQLRLVFQNLIDNSLKFRGEHAPSIRIAVAKEEDLWRFEVRDNGIGFEAKYAGRIFDMFQRLHPKTDYEGVGLGLTICRKVVERHGGRIWVASVSPSGTAIDFSIPF